MNAIRWIFFLTLSILLISSCNNASAHFHDDQSAAKIPQAASTLAFNELGPGL